MINYGRKTFFLYRKGIATFQKLRSFINHRERQIPSQREVRLRPTIYLLDLNLSYVFIPHFKKAGEALSLNWQILFNQAITACQEHLSFQICEMTSWESRKFQDKEWNVGSTRGKISLHSFTSHVFLSKLRDEAFKVPQFTRPKLEKRSSVLQ